MGLEMLVGLLVLGAILLWWFGVFTPTTAEAGQIFSSEILKAKVSKCAFDTQRAMEKGLVLNNDNDKDGDGLEDVCDPCVCSNPSCKNNDITQDNDRDDVPNGCDKAPNDRAITGCNFNPTQDGRCVEGAPPLPIKKV